MGLENPLHILIILAVVLMLFGAKRLPEMGKGLGSGIRGFKDGLNNDSPAEVTAPTPTPAAQTAATAPVPAPAPTPADPAAGAQPVGPTADTAAADSRQTVA